MIFKAPHGVFSFVLADAIFELLWYCNPSWWYGNGKDNISPNCRPTKVSITVSIDNVKSIINALIAMCDYFVREHLAYLQRAEARKRLCARFKKRK